MVPVPPETRAQVARQRLAELAATFDATLPDPQDQTSAGRRRKPEPARRRLRPVHVRFAGVTAGLAAVLTVWWLLAGRPQETAVPPASTVEVAGTEASAPATGELVVDVAGKVRRPGIVTLPPGSRVHEAIAAAGGVKGRVDTTALNLARVLNDGEQVVVGSAPPPAAAAPGASSGSAAAPGAPAGQVNLNTADLVALDTLPGVGPVTAEAIVAWRDENGPFRSVEDLLDVKGIGEATLAELRDRVTV
ncbi:ComEA family DNA-binding protein [Aeromicrobium senzhongii]|uniref:ComEA family DNA-binding protein n=1 Tax=Aeromicrobium senzhongii TaxID=2663859 RepID=A0ABX6SX20_9ACTN|nr:ComEA family DNA-binding protein [Aeromicrobium senzhongii]MTB87693.1 ComEA family DNA-binding protein [Aeromicrobium senzhongii]QNL95275.1 ComEA family DNA-binding protein [Aeromicrobium senzhongii]